MHSPSISILFSGSKQNSSDNGNFHRETVEDARAFIREMTNTFDKDFVIREKEATEKRKSHEKKQPTDSND